MEYQLPDGTNRLVRSDVVLTGDETVELDEDRAESLGLVPVEENECEDCGESFDSAQGLANHERTHEDN